MSRRPCRSFKNKKRQINTSITRGELYTMGLGLFYVSIVEYTFLMFAECLTKKWGESKHNLAAVSPSVTDCNTFTPSDVSKVPVVTLRFKS
jgi:hypothetical protein